MASANSIRIRELEEQKRKNDADIDVALRKMQIDENRLSEDIRNNLRNYNINLSKNQITKLANDQLNERELMSIVETMRSNLAKEVETKRHNLKEEELTLAEQAIKKMDVLLQGGKPTGKDAKAIMTSYLLNQTLLQAFGGTSVPYETVNWLINDVLDKPVDLPYGEAKKEGVIKYSNNDGLIKSGVLKGKYINRDTGVIYDTYEEYKESKSDIPADISNSRGPQYQGGKEYEKSTNKEEGLKTSGSGNTISIERSNREESSKGPGYNIKSSSDGKSSTIINTTKGKTQSKGPGWGLFS